jgi:hypothetical protein
MENLPGKYTVVISQDPQRILNKRHAEIEVEHKFTDEFGEHAYKKAAIQQQERPHDRMIETRATVCILSLEEMRSIYRQIQNLEAELVAYKNMMGRSWR